MRLHYGELWRSLKVLLKLSGRRRYTVEELVKAMEDMEKIQLDFHTPKDRALERKAV